MNDDLISRQATIRFIRDKVSLSLFMKRSVDKADKACMELCDMLDRDLPSAQPKKGKWEEIKVFPASEIELQSARCSACKRYHTTPYLYNYTHYNFCPHCGARMVNEDE